MTLAITVWEDKTESLPLHFLASEGMGHITEHHLQSMSHIFQSMCPHLCGFCIHAGKSAKGTRPLGLWSGLCFGPTLWDWWESKLGPDPLFFPLSILGKILHGLRMVPRAALNRAVQDSYAVTELFLSRLFLCYMNMPTHLSKAHRRTQYPSYVLVILCVCL